jgi:GntR family transcriptional regulator
MTSADFALTPPLNWRTSIDPASGVALYYQIKQDLSRRITAGELAPGSALPSEQDLCEAYGVSRPTVRQATQDLVNEHLLERRRGLGTFIAHPRVRQELGGLRGFTEKMQLEGRVPGTKVLEHRVARADDLDAETAAQLEVTGTANILRVVRVRLADGVPVMLETLSVPCERFPGIADIDLARESFYSTLRTRYGVVVSYLRETLEPVLLSKEEADALETKGREASISATLATYDHEGRAIEFTRSLVRRDASLYEIEVRRDAESGQNRLLLRQPQLDVGT